MDDFLEFIFELALEIFVEVKDSKKDKSKATNKFLKDFLRGMMLLIIFFAMCFFIYLSLVTRILGVKITLIAAAIVIGIILINITKLLIADK